MHPLNILSSIATNSDRMSLLDPRTSTLLSTRNSCAEWCGVVRFCAVISHESARENIKHGTPKRRVYPSANTEEETKTTTL